MLSGVYLIFGFYLVSLNNADNLLFKSSLQTATLVQSEQSARTGLAKALNYMGTNSSLYTYSTRVTVVNGDTVRYSATRPVGYPSSQSLVTVVASYTKQIDGSVMTKRETTMKAVYQFHNGRWKMMRVYTENEYQDSF